MAKTYRSEVICVGSELLCDRVNTDINILSEILAKAGISVKKCIIVGDEESEITDAVAESLKRSDILIITGGLGPTSDDITKDSVAKFLNRRLLYSEEIWESILEKFARRGTAPPEINKRQAYIIEESEVIKNPAGTAPGLIVNVGEKLIALFPGPPVELRPMAEFFAGSLKKLSADKPIEVYRFGISGTPESAVEEKVQPAMKKLGIKYTILAHPQMIEILIIPGCMPEKVEKVENFLKNTFNEDYMGLNPPPLHEIVGNILKEKKLKLAIAESCTGGLASKLVTDIPGSSVYFQGAFVAYSNTVKKRVLKVSRPILKKYGAVSAETAAAMAKGAIKAGKADVSLSFTGIAGPSGETDEKPAGLVFIGIGLPGRKYKTFKFIFTGNRERIREQAVNKGFYLLARTLRDSFNEK